MRADEWRSRVLRCEFYRSQRLRFDLAQTAIWKCHGPETVMQFWAAEAFPEVCLAVTDMAYHFPALFSADEGAPYRGEAWDPSPTFAGELPGAIQFFVDEWLRDPERGAPTVFDDRPSCVYNYCGAPTCDLSCVFQEVVEAGLGVEEIVTAFMDRRDPSDADLLSRTCMTRIGVMLAYSVRRKMDTGKPIVRAEAWQLLRTMGWHHRQFRELFVGAREPKGKRLRKHYEAA